MYLKTTNGKETLTTATLSNDYCNIHTLLLSCLHVCRPLHSALFSLDLIIDATGVHYSIPPETFKATLLTICDKGIALSESIEQLEKVC